MLDNSFISTILNDWSFRDKEAPHSIPRSVLDGKIWGWDNELITVVQGVRRCGKSTLLSQMLKKDKLAPRSCFFINFEDPRLSENLNSELLDQVLALASQLEPKGPHYFFLDEIQLVEGWEKWLHKQVERPKDRYFVVTGSNATLLGGKMSTALTGRHRTIELFPFDFSEFKLAFKEGQIEDYLERGGFPKALSIKDPESLLREYFTDILERDARKWVATRSPQTLPRIAKAVFESIGNETSLRKLAKLFDSTADSIGTYMAALLSSYLVLECPFFTFSERKRIVHPAKFYPIDTALHRSIVSRSGADKGKYLETIVFHSLRKRFKEVSYWKGKNEVDFVVQVGSDILPIQVTWGDKQERHEQGVAEFVTEFPKARPAIYVNRETVEGFLSSELV